MLDGVPEIWEAGVERLNNVVMAFRIGVDQYAPDHLPASSNASVRMSV